MLPLLGAGPARVADDLHVWLIAAEAPPVDAARAALQALPPELADWIRPTDDGDGGRLCWAGSVLHLNTGYGVRYYAQTLQDGHLAWLPEHGTLSDREVERVLDEVMDGLRKGPRPPTDQGWKRLGAQLAIWAAAVHDVVPLELAVIGRRPKVPGTRRHRAALAWAEEHLDSLAEVAAAQREEHDAWAASGWGAWVARGLLTTTRAKQRSVSERLTLLTMIDGAGLGAEREGRQLLSAWPKRDRAAALAHQLRAGHDLGPFWLADKGTHELLFDDEVLGAAREAPGGLLVPYVIDLALARFTQPKDGLDRGAWLSRWVEAMTSRVADLDSRAATDPLAAETLASWGDVRAQL